MQRSDFTYIITLILNPEIQEIPRPKKKVVQSNTKRVLKRYEAIRSESWSDPESKAHLICPNRAIQPKPKLEKSVETGVVDNGESIPTMEREVNMTTNLPTTCAKKEVQINKIDPLDNQQTLCEERPGR